MERRLIQGSYAQTGLVTSVNILTPYAAVFLPWSSFISKIRVSSSIQNASLVRRIPSVINIQINSPVPLHSNVLNGLPFASGVVDSPQSLFMEILNGNQQEFSYEMGETIFNENIPYSFQITINDPVIATDITTVFWQLIFERVSQPPSSPFALDFKPPVS